MQVGGAWGFIVIRHPWTASKAAAFSNNGPRVGGGVGVGGATFPFMAFQKPLGSVHMCVCVPFNRKTIRLVTATRIYTICHINVIVVIPARCR